MSARTERPTPRRIREARRRGEVAVSREITGAAALLAGLAAVALGAPAFVRDAAAHLRVALAAAAASDADPRRALVAAAALLSRAALPPCGVAAATALAAGALQTGALFSLGALRPRLERLDPWRGLARLASPERAAAVAFSLARTAVAVGVAWAVVRGEAASLAGLARLSPGALLGVVAAGSLRIATALAAALAGLGTVDLLLARRRHARALLMTREEVARERKDDEGDPHHRAERRRLHRALSSAPPLARATCLVVNPTHVAVALEHPRGSDEAPVVVAKGEGPAAARLRSAARRAGVPVVRDVALARALFQLAEVGDAIPEALYEAAAAVLVHIHGAREP